jgi:hypothetical protein
MFQIIFQVINHPLNKGRKFSAFIRFLSWQFISRLYKYPILLPYTETSNYLCWNGLTGLTGNWYFGLMEMEEMSFLAHLLRPNDVFYDIGANVGAYSILISQHSKCRVYSFEPHPKTFDLLLRNISIQKNNQLIQAYNFGLGEKSSSVKFTSNLDTVNHVSSNINEETIEVQINVLDDLNIPIPTSIKIDVEGFEYYVLRGGLNILKNDALKAIIIELNGSGINYGIEDEKIDLLLRSFNFEPYTYDPFKRKILKLTTFLNLNTIYIRDFDFCQNRVNEGLELKLANGAIL